LLAMRPTRVACYLARARLRVGSAAAAASHASTAPRAIRLASESLSASVMQPGNSGTSIVPSRLEDRA